VSSTSRSSSEVRNKQQQNKHPGTAPLEALLMSR
jgi:hypothetical protein